MIVYDKGEEIIHIARRHNVAFVLETIFLAIAAVIPYFAYQYGYLFWLLDLFSASADRLFFLHLTLYIFWGFILWILFFIAWSDYYLDAWIITDGRVIDVEQVGVFRRRINTFRLDKITGMTISKSWLGNLFDYGNLEIIQEGEDKLIIAETPNPEKIRELIADGQKRALERLQKTVQFVGEEK